MASWINGACETNGINTHYIRTGGDKPPVVLLHGLMRSGGCWSWSPLARELETNYKVSELLEQGTYTDPKLRVVRFCTTLLTHFDALWTFVFNENLTLRN